MLATESAPLKAAQVAEQCQLSAKARALLGTEQTGDAFLIALRNAGLYEDAILFLARWLGKRQAVWWGCQCLWRLLRPDVEPTQEAALRSLVDWVFTVSEDTRRRCEQMAEAIGHEKPLGMLALAAFTSSGSMGPADVPVIPAPEHLTAHCIGVALLMAGAGVADRLREFTFLGLDIAHGQNLWQ